MDKELAMDANLQISTDPRVTGFKTVDPKSNGWNGQKICFLIEGKWVFLPVEPIFDSGEEDYNRFTKRFFFDKIGLMLPSSSLVQDA